MADEGSGTAGGWVRYWNAYRAALLALPGVLLGLPASVPMFLCRAGIECLGWLPFVYVAAAVGVGALLFVLGLRFGLGWLWGALTFAAVAGHTVYVLGEVSASAWAVVPVLVPGLAAWATVAGRWQPVRVATVVLVLGAVSFGVRADAELDRVAAAEERYERIGVTPIGLAEDRDWAYERIVRITDPQSVPGIHYVLVDTRVDDPVDQPRLEVDLVAEADRERQLDLIREIRREARPETRYAYPLPARTLVAAGTAVLVYDPEERLTDAELDALVEQMEPKSFRWLATREHGLWRLLPGGR